MSRLTGNEWCEDEPETFSSQLKRKRTNSPKRQSSVNFANEVIEFSPTHEIAEHEFESMWYTKEEYLLIKRSSKYILKITTSRFFNNDDEEFCVRGLEARTKSAAQHRRRVVEVAVDTVLHEQKRQWEHGVCNPDYLAEIYRQSTADCVMGAYILARKDAEEVQNLENRNAEDCC